MRTTKSSPWRAIILVNESTSSICACLDISTAFTELLLASDLARGQRILTQQGHSRHKAWFTLVQSGKAWFTLLQSGHQVGSGPTNLGLGK
ncbi:MAG: hypothetical protein V3R25_06885, partial [Nitrosomonadaceae bacterium]